MDRKKRAAKVRLLIALLIFAMVYIGWLYYQQTLTGTARWDGISGVLLGLYICSHPAANMLDLILFRQLVWPAGVSKTSLFSWLVLNIFVLFIGWIVIFVGMTRFSAARVG
jgi:hypothetical protein